MLRLYAAPTLAEAYLVLHALERAGIATHVLNQHAQGGLGDIPFTQAWPEVWIASVSDVIRAREVVAEYEAAHVSGPPRRCRRCGEDNPATFESCWRCGDAVDPS
ncbi:MAG TPA: DUF2007 domain-containing protein [Burkholderiales bacterium]|nr:DUF2007 domain-containing protein [Burkholderiales bacterium]